MDSATIHFIGLVLFTTQVIGPTVGPRSQITATTLRAETTETRALTNQEQKQATTWLAQERESDAEQNDSSPPVLARPSLRTERVVALLPKVKHNHTSGTTTMQAFRRAFGRVMLGRASQPANPHVHASAAVVEDHTAMIVFQPSQVAAPIVGWTAQALGTTAFRYIELKGEQISFVANGVNGVASLPGLASPGLAPLQPPFQPPYSGASAVFMIPQGTLTPCRSTAQGVQNRIDTKLELKSHGTFAITAPGKSLTLTAGAKVYVVNVPFEWAATRTKTTSPVPHYKVYCDMIGGAPCNFPAALTANTSGIAATCNDSASMRVMGGAKAAPPPDLPVAIDVFCSNTQWP